MCKNQIIRKEKSVKTGDKSIETSKVKNFPFTLTDYKERTSYFNL